MSTVISVHNVTKSFGTGNKTFSALKDVSIECQAGEIVGIIGQNGGGKTTLLKTISGITGIDSGDIQVQGRIVSLLEVGAGFSMHLTGRENIYLNGSLLGISKQMIDANMEKIIEFSELNEFIDKPLFQYSSGMYVRLGFSVAIHSNPDILIVDETLAVGDVGFQSKCIDTIEKFKRSGKTVLFVSHDLSIVNGMCDRVYLLDKGKILMQGKPQDVIPYYLQNISHHGAQAKIKRGDFDYFFNDGTISIFYKGEAITKLYGLYSSIYSYKTWHNSEQAFWTIEELPGDQVLLKGSSRRLPIDYNWLFHFKGDNEIQFMQSAMIKAPIVVDEMQTSIMLTKDFTHWTIGHQNGEFPESPQKAWNNWQHLNEPTTENISKISAVSKERNLTVHYEKLGTLFTHQPTAIITSKDFNSNVLQFLNTKFKFEPQNIFQDTPVFHGKLTIEI